MRDVDGFEALRGNVQHADVVSIVRSLGDDDENSRITRFDAFAKMTILEPPLHTFCWCMSHRCLCHNHMTS